MTKPASVSPESLSAQDWNSRAGDGFNAQLGDVWFGPDKNRPTVGFFVEERHTNQFGNLGGADAMEEMDIVATGAGSVAVPGEGRATPVPRTNCTVSFYSGRVYKVNDNRERLFRGQFGVTTGQDRRRMDHQWIDERFQNVAGPGVQFQAGNLPSDSFALASAKTTDVLRIRPTQGIPGLDMDPISVMSNVGVKAAYYSAGFILRLVVAQALDIEPEELDVGSVLRVPVGDDRFAGELVINDRLPNGAGFTRWLHDNLSYIFTNAVDVEPGGPDFVGQLTSMNHRQVCDSASYCCLSEYRNMSYHGLLDWRLGLCLLRSLVDADFRCGTDGSFDAPFLAEWPELARALRNSICTAFDCEPQEFGTLPGFVVGDRDVLVVHPLWDRRIPVGELADAIGASNSPGGFALIDTFNLQRRPARAYESLADV